MEEQSGNSLAKRNPFTPQETRDLKTIFDMFDPSRHGKVSMNDLRKILKVLGFKCSRYQLQTIIKEEEMKMDKEGEESAIALSSRAPNERAFGFDNMLQVVDYLQGDDYDLYDEMQQTFQNLDHDKDGKLSVEDIRKASKQVGLRLTKSDVEEMIVEGDKNGDGLVSMEEFIQIMKQTALFK